MKENNLKGKTLSGLFWSFLDIFFTYFLTFIIGIILARLLSPREFGLIGMVTIFITISQSFIDSGFTLALIGKQKCTQTDFSTVFYFNLIVGVLLYILLFFSATAISRFFSEPQLKLLIQVLGLSLIFTAFTVVQRAKLTKDINFKLQTKISIISSIVSGCIGIAMAYNGFGVWSLVGKSISSIALSSLFLWYWNKWKPSLVFSLTSFVEMFNIGSKILAIGLIDTAYNNVYLLVIGKFFSSTELGYYTRAEQFSNLPSSNITTIIQRVSYPVLATIQEDKIKMKAAYQRLIKSTMLITFVTMFGMIAVAKPMILTLVGEKWLPSAIYLQLICLAGMLYPLQAINLNMLLVHGRTDLSLKLEIFKKILAIPLIIIGVFYGVKTLIICMILLSYISFYLNSFYSGRLLNYSTIQQVKDIVPSFLLAIVIGLSVFLIGFFLPFSVPINFLLQIIVGIILAIVLAEILKLENYIYLKEIVKDKLKTFKTTK
jgi:O-antigen/teichoic acid export membrane protein